MSKLPEEPSNYDPISMLQQILKQVQMGDPLSNIREVLRTVELDDPLKHIYESIHNLQLPEMLPDTKGILTTIQSLNIEQIDVHDTITIFDKLKDINLSAEEYLNMAQTIIPANARWSSVASL